jgi:hypothetical protein
MEAIALSAQLLAHILLSEIINVQLLAHRSLSEVTKA